MPLAIGRHDRRSAERAPVEIHSREDAHRLVEAVAARKVENSPAVKAWQIAKQSTWLALLVGAFLLFFFVSVIYQVINLV